MLVEFLLCIGVIVALCIIGLRSKYDYWTKRGVRFAKPYFVFGSYLDLVLFRKNRIEVYQDIYKAGEGSPYVGVIQTREPALYLRDPDVIRLVLGKDFSYFHDRGMPIDEKKNPLAGSLFTIEGARWRALRSKLTPTFTSGKMKIMLPLMEECGEEMLALLDPLAGRQEVVDMRDILGRFTMDVIGTCAFGLQCNSLRNPDAEFRKKASLLFKPSPIGSVMQLLVLTFPGLIKYLPPSPVMKEITEFFIGVVRETVKYREEKGVERNDFLNLLIQIKNRGTIIGDVDELKNDAFIKNTANMSVGDFEFTETLMTAQAFVFFLAGYETSSMSLSFTLIEMSHNPVIQAKLREEIDQAYEHNGRKWSYEALMGMSYLDKVISESLRMYPPGPILFRKVTQRYKMPDSDLILEKDLKVYIPVHAIHHDPEFYPDPETFDPERFSDQVKQTRHNYAYLPFGEGPRNCIGQRFGLLQIKLALAMLLQNFEFELGPDMPYPPVLSRTAFLMTTAHGTHLRIKRRTPVLT